MRSVFWSGRAPVTALERFVADQGRWSRLIGAIQKGLKQPFIFWHTSSQTEPWRWYPLLEGLRSLIQLRVLA
jgi:hypothetical protein